MGDFSFVLAGLIEQTEKPGDHQPHVLRTRRPECNLVNKVDNPNDAIYPLGRQAADASYQMRLTHLTPLLVAPQNSTITGCGESTNACRITFYD